MEVVKGSLDRFTGGFAVIYSDKDDRKFDIPAELVDCKAGSRVLIHLDDSGNVVRVEFDEKATAEAKKRISEKFGRVLRGEHLKKS